ncbi:hypothetical protein [Burkholderia diffusa]|uniref:hypothetical protein n=1 Tax=Burkholderia diffusa TaxID=488732 RepID=UPI0012D93783|nr:hypothetical protein [Burkholderia diffusa]
MNSPKDSMPLARFARLDLPPILVTVALCTLAAMLARRSTFYRRGVDAEMAANRFHSIDGLRGQHGYHAVISYFFYVTGRWDVRPSRLATLYGQGRRDVLHGDDTAVLEPGAGDRGGHLDPKQFFRSRVRRIVPMYAVSAGAMSSPRSA